MGNGIIRTRLGTLAALLTLVRVDVRVFIAHINRAEITGILTRFSHTLAAVVRHHIGSDGTLLTGRVDDLDHIGGILSNRALAFRQTYPLFDDLSLFINTAAELGLRSRKHLVGKFIPLLLQSPLLIE